MRRNKGEARKMVAGAIAGGGDHVSQDIATATGLTIGYTTLLLRELVQDKKAVRVRHGVYRSAEQRTITLPRGAAPGSEEDGPGLHRSLVTIRAALEHFQAIERLLAEFKPGNPQARIEMVLAEKHVLRAVDWITGQARPELPRPMGEESSAEVDRALSGRGAHATGTP